MATPVPQLFFWGAADTTLDSEYRSLAELAANRKLIVFPQGANYLMLDHVDELADAIARWHEGRP